MEGHSDPPPLNLAQPERSDRLMLRRSTLAIVAMLVTLMTSSAIAQPWNQHGHRRYRAPNYPVYRSFPTYENSYHQRQRNNRNVWRSNRSSYSRYPSSRYYNDGYYNSRSYNNWNNGYYRNGYYNNGPSLQLGPVRIDL